MRHTPLMLCAMVLAACDRGVPAMITPPPPDMATGDSVRGSLAEGDSVAGRSWEDRWSIDLAAGQRIRIELRSNAFDPVVRLRAPTGRLIAWNDDGLGRDAALTLRADSAGRHQVLVRSADSVGAGGDYLLRVAALADSVAEPGFTPILRLGDSTVGVLEFGDNLTVLEGPDTSHPGLYDVLTFKVDTPGVWVLDAASPHFTVHLALADTAAFHSMTARSGRARDATSITFRADSGMHYRVAVASVGSDRPSGRYVVTARPAGREPPTRLDTVWVRLGTVPPLMQRVCRGEGLPGLAAYDTLSRAIHPTAVETGQTYPEVRVEEWAAAKPQRVELVLCMERSRDVLQVCYYNGPSITRYRARWTARLRVAATGRLLHEAQVAGDAPRMCQSSESYSLTELNGTLYSPADALPLLRPHFARLINPADTTAPPVVPVPARRPRPRAAGGKAPGR